MAYMLQNAKFYRDRDGSVLLAVTTRCREEDFSFLIGPRTSVEVTEEVRARVKKLSDSEMFDTIIPAMARGKEWYKAHIIHPVHQSGDPEIKGIPFH